MAASTWYASYCDSGKGVSGSYVKIKTPAGNPMRFCGIRVFGLSGFDLTTIQLPAGIAIDVDETAGAGIPYMVDHLNKVWKYSGGSGNPAL